MESYQTTYEKYSNYCQKIAGVVPQTFEKWMRDRDGVIKPSPAKEFLDVLEISSPLSDAPVVPPVSGLLVGL